MKLPDYLCCVEVKEILLKMGIAEIPELKPVEFVHNVTKTKIVEVENPQISFSNRLKLQAVPLTEGTVTIGHDGIIEVNGIKSCAYIKKQRQGIDHSSLSSVSYRYHLCNCRTIERMIAKGHLYKYVSTTRDDGLFPVIDQSGDRAREIVLKLELCMNCMEILRQQEMMPKPYSLKEFFRRYQPEIPATIRKTEQVVVEEKYAPNHEEIARKYKEQSGYVCQFCGVNCSVEKQCLHLHHKDGNGQNNLAANLCVLCVSCHTREHPHMDTNPKFQHQRATVSRLRREQGIIELSD